MLSDSLKANRKIKVEFKKQLLTQVKVEKEIQKGTTEKGQTGKTAKW